MIVERIDSIDAFEKLRPVWELLHRQDPCAHIFSSWAWLRGYIDCTAFEWLVLALRTDPASQPRLEADPSSPASQQGPPTDSPFCAFLFLTYESKALNSWRILRLGGSPLADYTGIVCLPQCEEAVVSAIATYIQNELAWDQLHLWDVLDGRISALLSHFDNDAFSAPVVEQTPCPIIKLPADWDEFLLEKLSKVVRKKVRRRTKQLQELPGFRVEAVTDQNLESQIETLFLLWSQKWEQPADDGLRPIFAHLHQSGALWLTTLWDETTPIAALAGFVDPYKSVFYAFMGAYNNEYEKLSPGVVLDGYSLRYAIETGLGHYDYLRGDHEYKFRWGAETRTVPRIEIDRNSARTTLISGAIGITKKLKSF